MSRAELPVKLYYRIGEVAELVGVEPHVLRYWESEFGAIRPQKSPKGQRVYSRRDLEKLLRVKELLYSEGYTIAGAKKRLRDGTHGSGVPAAVAAQPSVENPRTEAVAERSIHGDGLVLLETVAHAEANATRFVKDEGPAAKTAAPVPHAEPVGQHVPRQQTSSCADPPNDEAQKRAEIWRNELVEIRAILRDELAALDRSAAPETAWRS